MCLHDPFGHLKHKLWLKQRLGIKLTILFLTTKSQELPRFLYVQVACDILLKKALDDSYNFASNIISIEGPHAKLWVPKVTGVIGVGISGLPLGSPNTKWHLGASSVAKHKVYYKGEGGGLPQVRVVVSLVSPSVHVACAKLNYALFRYFHLRLTFESIKELGSMSFLHNHLQITCMESLFKNTINRLCLFLLIS